MRPVRKVFDALENHQPGTQLQLENGIWETLSYCYKSGNSKVQQVELCHLLRKVLTCIFLKHLANII